MLGFPHDPVSQPVKKMRGNHRNFIPHEVALCTILNLLYGEIYLLFGGLVDALNFLGIAQIENRRPCIRHFHTEKRVEGKALPLHELICKTSCLARR